MQINKSTIDSYLKRYYAGHTTTEEEEALRLFFQRHDVPSKYSADKELFSALNQEYKPLPDEEIMGIVGKSVEPPPSYPSRFKVNIIRISVAASLLVAIGIGWLISMQSPDFELVDTYTDPEEAYHETKRILSLVSTTMNSGTTQIEPLSIVEKPAVLLEPLDEISKQMQTLKFMEEAVNHTAH